MNADELIISAHLDWVKGELAGTQYRMAQEDNEKARQALVRLMARCVPELPEGCRIGEMFQPDKPDAGKEVIVHIARGTWKETYQVVRGEGSTIREAVSAAIAKTGSEGP